MNRSLPLALTLLVVPLLGGGICGVRFQSAPVSAEAAKADPALFGAWQAEKTDAKAGDAGTLQVFESDGARTVFMLSGHRFYVESNAVDHITFLGHPFATATHTYLALRSASLRQDDIGEPARAIASGDVTIVRYRVTADTLEFDELSENASIAAVQKRAVRGTYVKAASRGIADDQLRIDDEPAAVLKWLDESAKWEPYEFTFRRAATAATPAAPPKSAKKKARAR